MTELAQHYNDRHQEAEQERIARLKKQKGSVYDMPLESVAPSKS